VSTSIAVRASTGAATVVPKNLRPAARKPSVRMT